MAERKKVKDPNAPKRHLSGYFRDPNAPERPLSAFYRFVAERKYPVQAQGQDFLNEWLLLPEIDKKRYLDAEELDKDRYKRRVEAYQKTESYKQFRQQQKKMTKHFRGDVDVKEEDASDDDDYTEDEEEDEELNLKLSLDLENLKTSNADVAEEEKEEVGKKDEDEPPSSAETSIATTKETTSTTTGGGDIGLLSLTVCKLTTVPATRTSLVTIRMINQMINHLGTSTDLCLLNEQDRNIMNADNILIFETQDVASEEVNERKFTMEEVVSRIQESKTPAVIIATVGEQRKMSDYFTNAATNHEREYCVLFVGENSDTDEIAYPNNMLMGVSTVERKMTAADNLLERYAFKILKNVSERLSQLTTTPTIDPYDVRDILVKIQCAVKRSGIPDSEKPELIPAEEEPETMIKAKKAVLAAEGVGGCTFYNGRLIIYMDEAPTKEQCVKQILADHGVTVYKIHHGVFELLHDPGDEVSSPANIGTLGGFARKIPHPTSGLKKGTPKLVALSARHVFEPLQQEVTMFVEDPPRGIGETTSQHIQDLDILPFTIFPPDENDCETRYRSIEDDFFHANLVEDNAWNTQLDGAVVHKYGTTTHLTVGTIALTRFYMRNNSEVPYFLIQEDKPYFGLPGDSGSIVCTMIDNQLFALGMLLGVFIYSDGTRDYFALRLKEAFHLLGTQYNAEFELFQPE